MIPISQIPPQLSLVSEYISMEKIEEKDLSDLFLFFE